MTDLTPLLAAGIILALLFGVVWLFLPFAVYGIKRRLDQQIEIQKHTRALLLASKRNQEHCLQRRNTAGKGEAAVR